MPPLPDRWIKYKPMGKVIRGTRFIAFKVPLKEAFCKSLKKDEWFTPQHIIDENPNISLIVDLTNTHRYYDKEVFQYAGKSYVKILCPGHVVPAEKIVSQFFNAVDKFLSEHRNDGALIGVHCTHGVNRTGYFLCKYMIEKMGIDPNVAIEDVGDARGYPIERENYLRSLKGEGVTDVPVRERARTGGSSRNQGMSFARSNANNRGRAHDVRSSHNDRGRTNWRRDDRTDNMRNWSDRPRYGRQSDFQGASRLFGNRDSDRGQNWRSRPKTQYEQGPSRNYSSDRYNRRDQSRNSTRHEDRSHSGPKIEKGQAKGKKLFFDGFD